MNPPNLPALIGLFRKLQAQSKDLGSGRLQDLESNSGKRRNEALLSLHRYFQAETAHLAQVIHELTGLDAYLKDPPYEDTLGLEARTDVQHVFQGLKQCRERLDRLYQTYYQGGQPKNYIQYQWGQELVVLQGLHQDLCRVLDKIPASD